MLDSAIKDQLKGLFAQLEAHYTFDIFVHPQHESRAELVDLLEEVASCSDKLSCRLQDSEGLKFILLKEGKDTGITFRAVPSGHEFTSLLMAVLNADGKGKNFPDEFITRRIKALQGPISLTTYLSQQLPIPPNRNGLPASPTDPPYCYAPHESVHHQQIQ